MLKTLMRPTAPSPIWIWGALLLVLLFVIWASSLMVSVNGQLQQMSKNIHLLKKLNRHEQAIHEQQQYLSSALAVKWRHLYTLAILSCLLVIVLTVLLNTYQRELMKRKKTEGSLRDSEERFRRLVESVSVIPWEANYKTLQFTYVGPRAVELLGYPVHEWFENDFWSKHLHPGDRDGAVNFCREACACQTDFELEYRMIAADGRIVWLRDYVSVILSDGGPRLLRGFLFDITARKQTEEALRESEERLRSLFNRSREAMIRRVEAGQQLPSPPSPTLQTAIPQSPP